MNPPTDKAMTPTQTHTPGPQWCGAYKADGTLAAVLESESEAYYYVRNRAPNAPASSYSPGCKASGTDPRGCSLYLLKRSDIRPGEEIGSIYNRGLAVCC